ncbi:MULTISPECIES: ABC transporter permease [unclassified Granulicatella]|uniref:ABC transporter permease n=1 Tax=unclassified Granulicatella TaxID=2630493 RepID=UPI0010737635|nr:MULTISPECIES: ABC transporter permease [unclassified Granulicatella]MBF0779540.1 ABC transporter permease [Granulicatella sp. 19428wC4_WM01]TFU96505.1 ABC transporter permease [Granulicatella sp. WM01]
MFIKGIKKIASILAALGVVSLMTFLLIKASSSDPAENFLRVSHIPITPEAVAKAREDLGLNLSLPEQYVMWLGQIMQGNFGISYLYKSDVLTLVVTGFLSTLHLGIVTFCLVLIGSLGLGLLSAWYRGKWIDKFIRVFTYISVSMPTFWLGYLLMIVFGVYLKILPVSGKESPLSIVLPSVTMSIPLLGQYIALIRRHAIEQLSSDHAKNAILRGVNSMYLIKNHVLKNMMPVMVSSYMMTFAYLITGSLIIEEVFSWRGIGHLFVSAVQAGDVPVIQACMLLFGVLFLSINALMQYAMKKSNPLLRKEGDYCGEMC